MKDLLYDLAAKRSYQSIPNGCSDIAEWRIAHIHAVACALSAEQKLSEKDDEIEAMNRKIQELERELRILEARE